MISLGCRSFSLLSSLLNHLLKSLCYICSTMIFTVQHIPGLSIRPQLTTSHNNALFTQLYLFTPSSLPPSFFPSALSLQSHVHGTSVHVSLALLWQSLRLWAIWANIYTYILHSGYGQQWWHLIWVMVTRQQQDRLDWCWITDCFIINYGLWIIDWEVLGISQSCVNGGYDSDEPPIVCLCVCYCCLQLWKMYLIFLVFDSCV